MKINLVKGKKGEDDKIIFVDSNNEPINIFDVAFIINQFAVNELRIIDNQGFSREKQFWFSELIDKAILDAKNGINWFEIEKDELLKLSDRPYFVKKKLIDKFFEDKDVRN